MDKAAKGVTPESIGEQIVAEAKEEVIEAPSRIRQILRQMLAAVGERASVRPSVSGSYVVVGSGLFGMYGAKFDALAKEHEQVRPDKG